MTVYLIHLERSLNQRQAQHYCGYTSLTIEARMSRHLSNKGAAFLKEANRQHIPWYIVRVWPDAGLDVEKRIKRGRHLERYCPVCQFNSSKGELPINLTRFERSVMEILEGEGKTYEEIYEAYFKAHPRANVSKFPVQFMRMTDKGLLKQADNGYYSYLDNIKKEWKRNGN